jgi:Tol biopolymer transport system component
MRGLVPNLFGVFGALAAGAGIVSGSPAIGAESDYLRNVRQLTFEGNRAGEGYFSRDGARMIFQSEREPGNPFYQMYVMDLETGDIARVSPGHGKTTCGWLHPDGERALFASSHLDPEAVAKQEAEIAERAAATGRRYSWSFDPHYDMFETPVEGGPLTRLTDAMGYDAEGSWSPDGEHILFASNRHAYAEELSAAEQEIFERDPSHFMELYVMRADGSDVRRLTDSPGYDGGPFYSHDGSKIVWRRFAPDGHSAEIYTMNADSSDVRPITSLESLSWAPFFHPSGDYVIFATNLHGYGNFELYLVDAEGTRDPVRVTETEGFDGLPVFSPDGTRLAWSSQRGLESGTQLFIADWDDAAARRLLGLDGSAALPDVTPPALPETSAAITPDDLGRHAAILASEEMEGRLTGSAGERLATAYVAAAFEQIGLVAAGDDGSYYQPFSFSAGVSLGTDNALTISGASGLTDPLDLDRDWRPLGLSANGDGSAGEVMFAGYGIVAPASAIAAGYDSYRGLDVTGKWVLVLRDLPEEIDQERRQALYRYAELSYKAAVARARGARGLIVVSGPNANVRDQLVPLSYEAAAAGTRFQAISVSDAVGDAMLSTTEHTLAALQTSLDGGAEMEGFALPAITVAAHIDLIHETAEGRNVLARLPSANPSGAPVMIGAHIDHLGRGVPGKSLAVGDEQGAVHHGADDNASGVAALLEVAAYLADLVKQGKLELSRDILFGAWSGEELGLLGSSHFVQSLGSTDENAERAIAAYLNMDMVGRLDGALILQGVGSSTIWPREIERRNVPVGLTIVTDTSPFMATDATAFTLAGIPVLNAFTGAHADYSTPRDTADKLNLDGLQKVARLMALITRSIASNDAMPDYVRQEMGSAPGRRMSRVYMGTIPDYAQAGAGGARLSGVAKDGPAEQGGLRAGDVIISMAGQTIETIYDYSAALDGLKIDEPVTVVVVRDGSQVELTVTPGARQ